MFASRSLRLVVFALAVLVVYGASRQIRVSTDAHLNYIQTRALVLHGDADLDRYGEQEGFVTRRGGHLYSVYGIGVSVVAAPLFLILARAGVGASALHAFGSIPFAAVAVLAMFVLLDRLFDRQVAIGGALVFGFGTTMWPIATTAFWQQAELLMLTSLGLLAFFSDDRRAPLWAGLALGFAVFVRPTAFLLAAFVGSFYLLRSGRLRSVAWYVVGLLPALAAIVVSNRWIWGSWAGGYGTAGIGFHGDVDGNILRLLFGWWRGLLPYSPVLLLAIVGSGLAILRHRDPLRSRMITLALASLASLLLYARWSVWWGGANQFGYRLLLDAVPALVVLGAYGAANVRALRVPGAVLGIVSIASMAAGSVPDPFWWDESPRVFARSFAASPLGRAWGSVPSAAWAARLAGVALAGLALLWASKAGREPDGSG